MGDSRSLLGLRADLDWLFIATVGMAVTTAALAGCSPCIGWMDAGDFVTASGSLGVPHATGFPVYTLAGHLASYLPFGSVAMRIATLSGICMGVTVMCLLMAFKEHSRNIFELLVPGITFVLVAFSAPTLFINSRVPEVYALNCAIAAGSVLCVQKYWQSRDARWCYALALLLGIGLSHHATFRLWSVLFVLAVVLTGRWRRTLSVLGVCVGLTCSALLSYLYLPAAALRNGPHNWGDPSNFERFWAHVNASEIQTAFREEMGFDVFRWQVYSENLVGQLWASLGPLLLCGLVAMLASTYLFCRRLILLTVAAKSRQTLHDSRRLRAYALGKLVQNLAGVGSHTGDGGHTVREGSGARGSLTGVLGLGLLMTGLGCLDFVYATVINPMGIVDWQNGQLSVLLFAGLGSFFAVKLLTWLSCQSPRFKGKLSVLGLFVPLSLVPHLDHAFYGIDTDYSVEDMVVIHAAFAEPESMTVLVSDSMIAAHLYASVILDVRPDMAMFGRNQLSSGRRFAYTARHQPFALVDAETLESWERSPVGQSDAQFEARATMLVAAHLSRRRVYWEVSGKSSDLPPTYPIVQRWPLGWVVDRAPTTQEVCTPASRSYCTDDLDVAFASRARRHGGSEGVNYRRWLAAQWSWVGRQQYLHGAHAAAMNTFRKSVELAPDRAAYYTNVAVCLAALGRPAEALEVVLVAVELDPLSKTAVKNAIGYAVAVGDEPALARLTEHAEKLGMQVR